MGTTNANPTYYRMAPPPILVIDHTYKLKNLLIRRDDADQKPTKSKEYDLIRELCGKYAGGPSLAHKLSEERQSDQVREATKFSKFDE